MNVKIFLPSGQKMRTGEEQRPRAHDQHSAGDVLGLVGPVAAAHVRHGDGGQQRADVVGAGDDAGLKKTHYFYPFQF